jgi:Rieske Fe-S protein
MMRLNESVLNRRDLLDGLLGAGVLVWGGVGGEMALSYLTGLEVPEPDEVVVGGELLEVLQQKRFVLVPYGPQPVLLLRKPDGELRAFSAVCTHLQCNVYYRPDDNDIFCNCHDGVFSADGDNIAGPPPRPLRPFYVIEQDDGTLLVSNRPIDDTARPESPDAPGTTVEG